MTGSNPDNRTDRDELAKLILGAPYALLKGYPTRSAAIADAILASDWLARRDAAVASRTRTEIADELIAEFGVTNRAAAYLRRARTAKGGV